MSQVALGDRISKKSWVFSRLGSGIFGAVGGIFWAGWLSLLSKNIYLI